MKRTVTKPTQPWAIEGYSRPQTISLAAEPFDLPPATRDETAPRSAPVRVTKKTDITLTTMGPRAMELYRYAENAGGKCTIAEAAEAIGMKLGTARATAYKYGFEDRFKGYAARPSQQGNGEDRAQRGALGGHKNGFSVDENLLPIDVLIK